MSPPSPQIWDGEVERSKMPHTLWTLILTARSGSPPDSQAALARLCEIYWFPLYTFVRRRGTDHHRAEDLTQAFFERRDRPWVALLHGPRASHRQSRPA